MKNKRVVLLFGLTAALTQACGQQSGKAPEAQEAAPSWQTDPALEQVRQEFGAPNQNVVLNPRAYKVEDTPSVADVQQVVPGSLVFGAQHAAWLLVREPGDVLYCGAACGGTGFLRRIVSLHLVGNTVVVETTQAYMTDLVLSGWVHGEVDVPDEVWVNGGPAGPAGSGSSTVPGATTPTPTGSLTPQPRTTAPNPPAGNQEATVTVSGPSATVSLASSATADGGTNNSGANSCAGSWEASLSAKPSFTAKMILDLAVTPVPVSTVIPNPSCSPCFTCVSCDAQWAAAKLKQGALVALFPTLGGDVPSVKYFRLELDPSAGMAMTLDISAKESCTYTKTLLNYPVSLGTITAGPILIFPQFDLLLNFKANATGTTAAKGEVSYTLSAKMGAY